MKSFRWFLGVFNVALISTISTSFSQGALITYVDALPNTTGSDGNTRLDVGGVPTLITLGTSVTTTNAHNDDKWNWSTGILGSSGSLYNNDNYFETDTGSTTGPENAAPLIVTLSGLTPGSYNFYVFFWGNAVGTSLAPGSNGTPNGTNSNRAGYDIAARVGNDGNYQAFKQIPDERVVTLPAGGFASYMEGTEIFTTDFSNEVSVGSAIIPGGGAGVGTTEEFMMAGNLGTFIVGPSGSIDIYVVGPDLDGSVNTRTRTKFDGVGYQLIPEPTSCVLFIFGTIGGISYVRSQRRQAICLQFPSKMKM